MNMYFGEDKLADTVNEPFRSSVCESSDNTTRQAKEHHSRFALEVSSRIGRIVVASKEDTMSRMDAYIVSSRCEGLKRQFQWAATRQLRADHYFMGRMALLG